MAADLHIHIKDETITEDVLKGFFASSMGSKYFDINNRGFDKGYDIVSRTVQIWIGEVSWLKAALTEDPETFVPPTVQQVSDLIGEDLPVLNDELIGKILKAFDAPNSTGYSLAKKEDVEKFLLENKGKQVFTVSW